MPRLPYHVYETQVLDPQLYDLCLLPQEMDGLSTYEVTSRADGERVGNCFVRANEAAGRCGLQNKSPALLRYCRQRYAECYSIRSRHGSYPIDLTFQLVSTSHSPFNQFMLPQCRVTLFISVDWYCEYRDRSASEDQKADCHFTGTDETESKRARQSRDHARQALDEYLKQEHEDAIHRRQFLLQSGRSSLQSPVSISSGVVKPPQEQFKTESFRPQEDDAVLLVCRKKPRNI